MKDSQYIDLGGWLTVGNALGLRELIAKHDVKTVLEIGTFLGLSTLVFTAAGCEVTTIDTFEGGPEAYLRNGTTKKRIENQLETLKGNLAAFGATDRVQIIKATSADAIETLRALGVKYDLVYIDGSHEYEIVRGDIEAYLPFAKKVLCGDDYTEAWPGVRRAVDELLPDADRSKRLWIKTIV